MILDYSRTFLKQYKKLSGKIKKQVGEKVGIFKENKLDPRLNNHQLHHPFKGCRSINVSGNIRAIYEEIPGGVLFIRIGTHSELYE